MLKFLKLETLRESGSFRGRIAVLYAALIAFNIGAWLWAISWNYMARSGTRSVA
jgi:hypothetical protein